MSELERQKLFKAWAEALTHAQPDLTPRLRQRVLEAHARKRGGLARAIGQRWVLAGGFTLAAALAVILVLLPGRPSAPSFQVAGKAGEVGAWLSTKPTESLSLQFSEGTSVALGKDSQGRVAGLMPGGARLELSSGSLSAEVAHTTGAHWSFGAGPFDVTVTGTKLSATWAPEHGKFEVSVSQGSVVVRGPLIPQAQEVRAGQVCRVDLKRQAMEFGFLTATPVAAAPAPSGAALAPAAAAPVPVVSAAPQPSAGAAARVRSAEELLEEARAARMAGRSDLERAALLACRKRAPGQAAAAQAAYLLGRASPPGEATAWFETYLREMPRGLLAREAAGRLIETYNATGNVAAAQSAASRYLARYPKGPHAAMARQLLATRSEGRN